MLTLDVPFALFTASFNCQIYLGFAEHMHREGEGIVNYGTSLGIFNLPVAMEGGGGW